MQEKFSTLKESKLNVIYLSDFSNLFWQRSLSEILNQLHTVEFLVELFLVDTSISEKHALSINQFLKHHEFQINLNPLIHLNLLSIPWAGYATTRKESLKSISFSHASDQVLFLDDDDLISPDFFKKVRIASNLYPEFIIGIGYQRHSSMDFYPVRTLGFMGLSFPAKYLKYISENLDPFFDKCGGEDTYLCYKIHETDILLLAQNSRSAIDMTSKGTQDNLKLEFLQSWVLGLVIKRKYGTFTIKYFLSILGLLASAIITQIPNHSMKIVRIFGYILSVFSNKPPNRKWARNKQKL